MNEDVLIAVAFATAVVMVLGHVARVMRTNALQKTIREAIRSNSGLTVGLLDKIDEQQPSGNADDRTGLVLIALGAALFGYAIIVGDAQDFREIAGIALFPIFVGAALLARFAYLARRSGEQ